MGSYIRKIIQLESSLKASEQSFANAVHKVESQSKENTILRARLTAAETARDEAQSCCASVADRLNTMIRETGPMTEQVREYLSITSMVSCIDVLSSRYFQLKLDRDELRERVKVVEQDNERLATLQGDARMALPSNANHTKSVAENIKALVKGAEIFCEKYNAINQERDALETEVERLNRYVAGLTKAEEKARDERSDAIERARLLGGKLDAALEDNATLDAEVVRLEREWTEIDEQRKAAVFLCENHRVELERVRDENERLRQDGGHIKSLAGELCARVIKRWADEDLVSTNDLGLAEELTAAIEGGE